ncbi:MAG TPA: glycosyl transferase [Thermoanaerobaculia bacterium]|nr:glycosyl transferase [Thermoanaerobaculia bacterium]
MSDFHQSGPVTTLTRLGSRPLVEIEEAVARHTRRARAALLIPCLVSEMDRPALARICDEVKQSPFLDTVMISLDRADADGYKRALEYFRRLERRTVVLWNDGPGVLALEEKLAASDLRLGERGKGRACWMAFGYLLAQGNIEYIALHDADVLDYDRAMLARLLYPLVDPIFNFDFCKGFYARFSDRLNGRVARLFVGPLLQSLGALLGPHPYIQFLQSFRYPLSGEFAVSADLARQLRVPSDWGLEIGVLSELFRHRSPRRVCQIDIADRYDHKHQALSADDPAAGLNRMAGDIAKHLLRTLAAADVVLSEGALKSLLAAYQRRAEDAVNSFYAIAKLNGLTFVRHEEETAVATFAHALKAASEQFTVDPLGAPQIPNWARVISAVPDAADLLLEAAAAEGGILGG